MDGFTDLEVAALRSIFSETPEVQPVLEQQLAVASVAKRENSGSGFFSTIIVAGDVPDANCPRILGYQTHARVAGLEHGLGFLLFVEAGRLHMLEGFALAAESTASLNPADLRFEVYKEVVPFLASGSRSRPDDRS